MTDTAPEEDAETIRPRSAETGAMQAEPSAAPMAVSAAPDATAPQWGQWGQPPGAPAVFAAAASDPEAAARSARRRRAARRWSAAVGVTLVVGAACAYAATVPKRTDIPGLATAGDGRYDFPPLTLPTLPAGQLKPGDADNAGARHLADIRKLLLPAPHGSAPDAALPGAHGWVSASDTAKLFNDSGEANTLGASGLRHTAAEGWTTASDGATTKVYVLQLADDKAASAVLANLETGLPAGADGNSQSDDLEFSSDSSAPYWTTRTGGASTRYGTFQAGDAVVLVVQSGPAGRPLAPFQQVLLLQDELLG